MDRTERRNEKAADQAAFFYRHFDPKWVNKLRVAKASNEPKAGIADATLWLRDRPRSLRKAEDELRGLAAAPDYSEAKARSLADAAAKAMADMTLVRVDNRSSSFRAADAGAAQAAGRGQPGGESPRGPAPGA